MSGQLDARYSFYDSIEAMLAPESLSRLLARPVTRVAIVPMNGHGGLAGGRLDFVETNAGRLVLKRMSLQNDWIMFASGDRQCRAARLWQFGMLDRLLPHVEHKQLACAHDGDGWGILMHDLTGSTFNWDTPFSAEMVRTFLDVMARIHATFWNDTGLHDARVGLCTPAQLLDMTALPVAGKLASHGSDSPIPEWIRGGWAAMPSILDPEIFRIMRDLIEDPQPLFEAVRRYPVTLLHGDYRTVNLAYIEQSCPVVYDWQEATASLMTIDLAWFVKYDYAPDAISVEEAVSFYRDRLESYLGVRFDDREWQAMLDLGGCFDALRSACFGAYFYSIESDPKHREFNERLVNRQGQFVRNALRWL